MRSGRIPTAVGAVPQLWLSCANSDLFRVLDRRKFIVLAVQGSLPCAKWFDEIKDQRLIEMIYFNFPVNNPFFRCQTIPGRYRYVLPTPITLYIMYMLHRVCELD